MKRAITLLALSICLASPFAATEQDTKAAPINEYFSYIPMKTMMDEIGKPDRRWGE